MAGLVAAVTLSDAGLDPLVLEANARVGGRIKTHRFPAPHGHSYGELGAMRIPAAHHRVLTLIDRLGLSDRLINFPCMFSDPASLVDLNERVYKAHKLFRAIPEQYSPAAAAEHLALLFDAVAPRNLGAKFRRDVAPILQASPYAPFAGVRPSDGPQILRQLLTWAADHHKTALGTELNAATRELIVELGTAHTLAGGLDQLPRSLAQRLRGRIRLRHQVVAINEGPDGIDIDVAVTSSSGITSSKRVRLHADYAVCALPPMILPRIQLSGIPPTLTNRFATHATSAASKTLLHVSEAFWTRDGIHIGGGSASDQLIRQVFYPPPRTNTHSPCPCAVITACYAIDVDTVPLNAMHERERTEAVIHALARIHPAVTERGMILGWCTMDWNRNPFSLGGFDGDWTPDAQTDREAPTTERITFASDTYSPHPGWIEGAVHSGWHAANNIIDRNTP